MDKLSTIAKRSSAHHRSPRFAMLMFRRIGLLLALSVAAAAHAYDAVKWREDFAQARQELARSYANLDWVVAQRRIDLQALVQRTDQGLATARDDVEAAKVLTQFLDTFGDGHLYLVPPQRKEPLAAPVTTAAASATDKKTCRDLGYEPIRRDRAGIDFGSTGQYEALTNEDTAALPAGVLKAGNRTLGVIRIGLFAEQAFPTLCEREHPAPAPCDAACEQRIFTRVGKTLTRSRGLRGSVPASRSAVVSRRWSRRTLAGRECHCVLGECL